MLIRVWMRTAVRKGVTSRGTFLTTLCHEFCHHLDFHLFRQTRMEPAFPTHLIQELWRYADQAGTIKVARGFSALWI